MGPKKKEKGKAEPKEINRADFVRTPEIIQELKGVSDISRPISGDFFKAQDIFEPWSEEEKWADVEDLDLASFSPRYPPNISTVEPQFLKSSLEYLGLAAPPSEVDPKAAAAAKKKGKDAAIPAFNDDGMTEEGLPLPRVYAGKKGAPGSGDKGAGDAEVLRFRRQWTLQQVAVKAQLQEEEEAAAARASAEKKQSVENTGSGGESKVHDSGGNDARDRTESADMTLQLPPAVSLLEPEGPELDPLMCAAFRLVAQYARSFCLEPLGESTAAVPFLWGAIHPQLPGGVPCYNPAGKYCVKLFVGGRWVKVRVLDAFPVGGDDLPLLASSASPLELWPAILAKAVYSVCSALGLHHSLLELQQQESSARQAAAFVSFAVHTLTGWLPSTPRDLSDIYANESMENISTLLEEVNFGGASVISARMIPAREPVDLRHLHDERAKSTPRKFTKKQLRDEMKRRLLDKDTLVKRILKREKHVGKIDGCVVKKFSEAFALVVVPRGGGERDEGSAEDELNLDFCAAEGPSVYPVLALSYPNRTCDDTDVEVLVEWRVQRGASPQPTVLSAVTEEGGTSTTTVTGSAPPPTPATNHAADSPAGETPRTVRRPFSDSEYPHSTPVSYQWLSLKTLCRENSVYLFGSDTKLRTSNTASFGWHWKQKEEPLDDKAASKKDKGKGSKDKDKDAEARRELGVPQVGVDPGVFPPVLLRVTAPTRPLLSPLDPRKDVVQGVQTSVADAAANTSAAVGGGSANDGNGQQESKQEQEQEVLDEVLDVTSNADSSSVFTNPIDIEGGEQQGKDRFLSLSLLLQADLARPQPQLDGAPHVEATAGSVGESGAGASSVTEEAPYCVPDDAVLVLQEVRTDGAEPLVMRLQLCRSSPCPLARATFHIPLDKLYSDDCSGGLVPRPVLFLVRVFSSTSLELSFHSECSLTVQDAGECWVAGVAGGQRLLQTGISQANYMQTERVLFRLPLQLADSAASTPPSSEGKKDSHKAKDQSKSSGKAVEVAKQVEHTPDTTAVTAAVTQGEDAQEDQVLFFFHAADKEIFKTVSLAMCDGDTETTLVAPALGRNVFTVKRGSKPLTIVGRSFHPQQNVPEFSWQVCALSRLPLQEPELVLGGPVVPEPLPVQRYRGQYMPNNQLKIVGDVVSVDPAAFPLSLRFCTERAAQECAPESPAAEVDDHLAFAIKIYSLPSRTLVRELCGRNLTQYYLLDKQQLLEAPAEEEEGAEAGAGDKKDPKKDPKKDAKKDKKKKGGDEVPDDALQFLLEVLVDETRMVVPPAWKSRYPHRFYQADGSSVPAASVSALEQSEVLPGFSWQLDVTAGRVLQLRHDTHAEEHFAATKNQWEDASSGRADRAASALAYVTALRSNRRGSGRGGQEAGAGAAEEKSREVADAGAALSLLCEALDKDAGDASLLERERILQFVPEVREHVKRVPDGEQATLVDLAQLAAEHESHALLLQSSEEAAALAAQQLEAFNEKMRGITLERLSTIRAQVKTSFDECIEDWQQRIAYQANVEMRNAALQSLLGRAAEAKEKAFAPVEEEGAGDKKGGKGKAGAKTGKAADKKKK